MNATIPSNVGSWTGALQALAARGLQPAAFVDVGCADGHHGLLAWCSGFLGSAQIVNIDANPIYEPTLRRIKAVIGGHYRISAVSDQPGTLEFHRSAHPYWASGARANDSYWASVNNLRGTAESIPCQTLDTLLADMNLAAPLVLKLDVQGLEAPILRGSTATLASTAVVICEMQVPAFHDLHSLLADSGFELFDLTNLNRTEAQTLGWLDGVYVNRRYGKLVSREVWAPENNAAVVRMQEERRQGVLNAVEELLALIQRQPGYTPPR